MPIDPLDPFPVDVPQPSDAPPGASAQAQIADIIESSLLNYLSITGEATLALQDALYQTSVGKALSDAPYFRALQQAIQQVGQLSATMGNLMTQWTTVQQGETAYNTSITTYNTSVKNAVDTLNPAISTYSTACSTFKQAQTDFNNHVITQTQFNAATSTYNTAKGVYLQAVQQYQTSMASALTAYQAAAQLYTNTVGSVDISSLNAQIKAASNNQITQTLKNPTLPAPAPSVNLTQNQTTQNYVLPAVPSSYTPPAISTPIIAAILPSTLPIQTLTSPPPQVTPVFQDAPAPTAAAKTSVSQQASSLLNTLSSANSQISSLNVNLASIFQALVYDPSFGPITLPPSYMQRHYNGPNLSTQNPTGDNTGAGSSDNLITKSSGLGNAHLQRILSDALKSIENRKDQTPLPPFLYDLLEVLAKVMVSRSAAHAGASTVRQLTDKNGGARTAPKTTLAASALNFADEVRKLTTTGELDDAIEQLLKSVPEVAGLPDADKQGIAKALSAAFKLGLLNAALSFVGISLGLPGLSAQVLGNVNGAPDLSQALTPSEQSSIDDAFNDPIKTFFLEQTLINLLANAYAAQGTSIFTPAAAAAAAGQQKALDTSQIENVLNHIQALVIDAIKKVIRNKDYRTQATLQSALATSFAENGIEAHLANHIAAAVVPVLASEAHLPALDTAFQEDKLPFVLASLKNQVEEGATGSLTPYQQLILGRLVKSAGINPNVALAFEATAGQHYATNREFRSAFIDQQLALGISAADAAKNANLAIQLFLPSEAEAPASPLVTTSPRIAPTLTRDQLVEELTPLLRARLSPEVSPQKVEEIINSTVNVLIGSNSFITSYNEQLRVLRQTSHNEAVKKQNASIATISHPSIGSIVLSDILYRITLGSMDPNMRNTLTGSSPGREPTNFKRDIDIRI